MAELIKSYTIPNGSSEYTIEFYLGSILDIDTDIIITSAVKSDYFPNPGTVWEAIRDKYGISYGTDIPKDAMRINQNLLIFPFTLNTNYKKHIVLEIKETRNKTITIGDIKNRFSILKKYKNDIVTSDMISISMPLLGTGVQQIDSHDITTEIIELTSYFMETEIKIFRLFVVNAVYLKDMFDTIETKITAGFFQHNSFLSNEFSEYIKTRSFGTDFLLAKELLVDIEKHLRMKSFSAIAIESRKYLEQIVKQILSKKNIALEYNLDDNIGLLQKQMQLDNGILSAIKVIQKCGNKSAHGSNSISESEVIMVIGAVLCVIDYCYSRKYL